MSTSSSLFAMVKTEKVAACLTCPLCNELFTDATTISECLHSFCRNCISDKITEEDLNCCPVCNISLGCAPLEKLRADRNLQAIRVKMFAVDRRKCDVSSVEMEKTEESDAMPSVPLPVRRRERSLSSLVVRAPKLMTQSVRTGRRSNSGRRCAITSRGSVPLLSKEPIKGEDHPWSSMPPELLSNIKCGQMQDLSVADSSKQRRFSPRKTEAASTSNPADCISHGSASKSVPLVCIESETCGHKDISDGSPGNSVPLVILEYKTHHHKCISDESAGKSAPPVNQSETVDDKAKEANRWAQRLEAHDKKNVSVLVASGPENFRSICLHDKERSSTVQHTSSLRRRKMHRSKNTAPPAELTIVPQPLVDVVCSEPDKRTADGSDDKFSQLVVNESGRHGDKKKGPKEWAQRFEAHDNMNVSVLVPSSSEKPKRICPLDTQKSSIVVPTSSMRPVRMCRSRNMAPVEELTIMSQAVVDAASSKPDKRITDVSARKSVLLVSHESETRDYKGKGVKEWAKILEACDKKNVSVPVASTSEKSKTICLHDTEKSLIGLPTGITRPRRTHRSKGAAPPEGSKPQAVVDAASSKLEQRITAIWFTLVASAAHAGYAPLPQIPSYYLRVKNINIPALIISKYVARKLDLPSEAEVEIMFQGYPVIPTLQLRHLIDLWLQTRPTPSERIQTYVGSSAKDFVMELNYARKVHFIS
ncbi:hypothetical protein Nepgr_010347 [Nepenthes gracilis]|uniref:RING-type domain-containing protein n=1 Tax=Nepenthes gracilis TaxID=150966 RepID=A0AAD3SD85_NEPGR|nr:hypothetical protein Nepgr_010347 [Nepenthes gracilis]